MSSKLSKRVLFVGIPDMAFICLDGLLMTGVNIVGVIGPKQEHDMYLAFKHFVEEKNLELIEYETLDDFQFIKKIKELEIDIAVVCSFNYKIPKELLNATKDGFINIHPSLLPYYRGGNPYSWPIIHGEKTSGVTLHLMNESFDTGDIIAQREIPLSPMETMGILFNRTNMIAIDMLIDTLIKYENGELNKFKQPEGDYPKAPLFKDDMTIIDFSQPAEKIERFIRALNPFLIASTEFRRTPLKIFSAEVLEESCNHPIGHIAKIENDKFYISTSKGLIAPITLQFGSFFVGSATDFIKIIGPKIGEKFE